MPTLERVIHSTGFFRAKARSINGMARALVEHHRGEVPKTLDGLVALPGVGRKTANVVLSNAFGIPALYLLANHLLFNPALVDALGSESESWLQITTAITGVTIAVIVAWDAIDGFLKARRSAAAAR